MGLGMEKLRSIEGPCGAPPNTQDRQNARGSNLVVAPGRIFGSRSCFFLSRRPLGQDGDGQARGGGQVLRRRAGGVLEQELAVDLGAGGVAVSQL